VICKKLTDYSILVELYDDTPVFGVFIGLSHFNHCAANTAKSHRPQFCPTRLDEFEQQKLLQRDMVLGLVGELSIKQIQGHGRIRKVNRIHFGFWLKFSTNLPVENGAKYLFMQCVKNRHAQICMLLVVSCFA